MIIDIITLLIIPLILIKNELIMAILYLFLTFINGFWVLSIFVYCKDISIVQQPSFVAIFMQGINSVGLAAGKALKVLLDNIHDKNEKNIYMKVLIVSAISIPCLYQLLAFNTYMKDEPVRYIYEKYGEEYAYESLSKVINDRKSVRRIITALVKVSVYRKSIGIRYFTIFSKYYRKALSTCILLFTFKGVNHILSFSTQIPHELKDYIDTLNFINCVMKIILIFLALFIFNTFSRQKFLIIGYLCHFIGYLACTILMFCYRNVSNNQIIVLCLTMSIIITQWIYFSFITYVPYVFALELLPDKGVAFTIAFYSLYHNFYPLVMLLLKNSIYIWCCYLFIALTSLLALVFVFKCVKSSNDVSEEGAKKLYFEIDEEDEDSSENEKEEEKKKKKNPDLTRHR